MIKSSNQIKFIN